MAEEWITVKEAAGVLKVSERTVRRRIETNKLKATRNGRLWLVHRSLTEPTADTSDDRTDSDIDRGDAELIRELRDRIQHQSEQLRSQNERIGRLEQLLAMEKAQTKQLLDYQLQPFWRRWRKRKQLPSPGDIVDVETGGEKNLN